MIPRVLETEVMDTAQEAQDYDSMDHADVNARFSDDFAAFAGVRKLVLDVGTGTARIPILICSRAVDTRCVAMDLADEMLALARANCEHAGLAERIVLAKEDAKGMSFAGATFDAVVSNTILHHIPEAEPALHEMWRVLKPKGALFVRDLARPESLTELAALVELYAAAPPADDARVLARHRRQRALFEASLHAGLRVDEMRAIVERIGMPASAVQMTSDRHWTLAHVKP